MKGVYEHKPNQGFQLGNRLGARATGEESPNWKGVNVKYSALHVWVRKELGRPKECEHCGIRDLNRMYHWANRSGEYKRELTDWIRLCVPCHRKYDHDE